MLFRKCGSCRKKRVVYEVSPGYELCQKCLMMAKLKFSSLDDKQIHKLFILDSLTGLGGFLIYYLFPPLILYDIFAAINRKRKHQGI